MIIFYSFFAHNHIKELDIESRMIYITDMITNFPELRFYYDNEENKFDDQNLLINSSYTAQKLLLSSDGDKQTTSLLFRNIS